MASGVLHPDYLCFPSLSSAFPGPLPLLERVPCEWIDYFPVRRLCQP